MTGSRPSGGAGRPPRGSARKPARKAPTDAREVALSVFLAWETSQETADRLLDDALVDARLPGRDRDLAVELVRGVFRWRGRLDWQIAPLVSRPLAELDGSVRWILRLGLHQLENLDRIPGHAAVDTSVELAKRFGHRGTASLVNAVLRRAAGGLQDREPPDPSEDPIGHLEVRTSHPRWLLERWHERWGFAHTLELAASNNRKPALTLRITSDRVEPVELLEELRAEGAEAEPGRYIPGTIRLPGGWHRAVRRVIESGVAVVQDEAAGLVAHVMRPERGVSLLDVCAAPGGKTIHFAGLCGDARIVAADRSPGRLRLLRESIRRVGVRGVHAVATDGRSPATRGGFDRVLVDAPCSNTGVLGKRPDARWRRVPGDIPRLTALQSELLESARGQVAEGGLLIYSTCSLEPEENEAVIAAYLQRHPDDVIAPASDVLPEELIDGAFLSVDPVGHDLDGAFAAAIRPSGSGPEAGR